MLQFNCPDCGKLFETDDSYAGGQVICDKCGFHFFVPEMEDIDEVIVEYVDEKTLKKEHFRKNVSAAFNKLNLMILASFLLFSVIVGSFLYLRYKRIAAEKERQAAVLDLKLEIEKENKLELQKTLKYLQKLQKHIADTPYDRGQGFGTHIDRFVLDLHHAEELFKAKQYSECEKKMRSAKSAADWVIKNEPLRRHINQQLNEIAESVKKGTVSETKLQPVKKAYYYYSNGDFNKSMLYLKQYHGVKDAVQR